MAPATVVLVALLTALVILMLYAVAKESGWHRAQLRVRASASKIGPRYIYGGSNGDFDAPARAALRRIEAAPDPTAGDHLLAATIIARNVLQRDNPVERSPATGRPTRAAVDRTRARLELYGRARRHLINALDVAQADAEAPLLADFAAGFAHGGFAVMIAHDPLVTEFELPGIVLDFDEWGAATDVAVAGRAGALREQVINARQHEARAIAGPAPGAVADAYVALATAHVNDGQNVHDHSVLACLQAIVARLRTDQGTLEALPSLDTIVAEVTASGDRLSRATPAGPPRPERTADALAVIARTRAGERVVAVGATDEECLRRVWARADDPRNVENRDALRTALFDGLVDCWESNPLTGRQIMCVNGRTGHILGSLAMLDWDRRNWVVERLEHFKNSIFARARAVVEREAAAALASGDPELEKAGKLYLAKTAAEVAAAGTVDDAAIERLSATMRTAIATMVDEYVATIDENLGAESVVPAYMVESIKSEAQAAVG